MLFAQSYRVQLPDGRETYGQHLCEWRPGTAIKYLWSSPFNLLPPYESGGDYGFSRIEHALPSRDQDLLLVFATYLQQWQRGEYSQYDPLGEIRVINIETGISTLILNAEQLNAYRMEGDYSAFPYQIAEVPDTDIVLFNTHGNYQLNTGLTSDLHLIDMKTLRHEVLLETGQGGQFSIAPDGKYVAITKPDSVNLFNLGTRAIQQLLNYAWSCIACDTTYYASPVWSDDSQSLIVEIPVLEEDGYTRASEILLIEFRLDGSSVEHQFSIESSSRSDVIFSPDLSLAIYQDHVSRVVRVIDLATDSLVTEFMLPMAINEAEDWLDDSSFIVLGRPSNTAEGAQQRFYVVNIEDGTLVQYIPPPVVPPDVSLSCTPPPP